MPIGQQAARLAREVRGLYMAAGPRCSAEYVANIVRFLPNILRATKICAAPTAMARRSWVFSVDGARISVLGEDSSARELYSHRVYSALPYTSESTPGTASSISEQNRGLFTIAAAQRASRVLSVEAQSEFLPIIKANAARNDCSSRVTPSVSLEARAAS